MRTYDVHVTRYLKGTKKNAIGLVERRTGKTIHVSVRGKSKESVKNTMKRRYPNSMIHVFVHY